MIEKLFALNNIKYIISVDDCFYSPTTSDMKARVYSCMVEKMDPFEELLASGKHKGFLKEIEDMKELGEDTASMIHAFLDDMEDQDISAYYEKCDSKKDMFEEEQKQILSFLDESKNKGWIEDYRTFSSTKEANLFDCRSANMTNGAILWLIDLNFDRISESEEAGLKLAENILGRESLYPNYIYCLTAKNISAGTDEDQTEAAFDRDFATKCDKDAGSLIYYIPKGHLRSQSNDKIAKSLAQGFKRKVCFELMQLLCNCLEEGTTKAIEKAYSIRQKALNNLFDEKTINNGESFVELAARLVNIQVQEAYRNSMRSHLAAVTEKAKRFETLCRDIRYTPGEQPEVKNALKEYRELETYNNHVNLLHYEIQQGDIFEIESSYYILVSQACESTIRSTGKRTLSTATLLQIKDNNPDFYKYSLSCFKDMKTPAVSLSNALLFPFAILDLCVVNEDGQASIDTAGLEYYNDLIKNYTENYKNRFGQIFEEFATIYKKRCEMDSLFSEKGHIDFESARAALMYLENESPQMKKYSANGSVLTYPVRRVARISERLVVDITNKYGTTLSRIGHPFDYTKKDSDR